MLLLFQAIKKRSPSTEIRVLMSDDGNISDNLYNKPGSNNNIIVVVNQITSM